MYRGVLNSSAEGTSFLFSTLISATGIWELFMGLALLGCRLWVLAVVCMHV